MPTDLRPYLSFLRKGPFQKVRTTFLRVTILDHYYQTFFPHHLSQQLIASYHMPH